MCFILELHMLEELVQKMMHKHNEMLYLQSFVKCFLNYLIFTAKFIYCLETKHLLNIFFTLRISFPEKKLPPKKSLWKILVCQLISDCLYYKLNLIYLPITFPSFTIFQTQVFQKVFIMVTSIFHLM